MSHDPNTNLDQSEPLGTDSGDPEPSPRDRSTPSRKRFVAIFAVVTLVLLLAGGGYAAYAAGMDSGPDLDAAEADGAEEGVEVGHAEGRQSGATEGRNEGVDSGYETAYEKHFAISRKKAYDAAYDEAFATAKAEKEAAEAAAREAARQAELVCNVPLFPEGVCITRADYEREVLIESVCGPGDFEEAARLGIQC